jgi:hypothetical protein
VRGVVVLALVLPVVGCRQNDDPEGARALFQKAESSALVRAPGYPGRTPSFTAHSKEVEIWVNEPIAKALAGPDPISAWPIGSLVRKEGFSGDKRTLVALMEKRADGWYWAETDGDGESLTSASDGKPSVCVDCHGNRAKYSDWVYSFELPK